MPDHAPDPAARRALLAMHNVRVGTGSGPTLLFAHGYGCDQSAWRFLLPRFEDAYRTVAFDYVGCGRSTAVYERTRYADLAGYADDVLAICGALGGEPVVFIGHSVSAMIGALAAARAPERFRALVMVGPSPSYISHGDYHGGFEREDIEGLLDLIAADHTGWAAAMAPTIMGNPDRPELSAELEAAFCRMDPAIARQFARTTFTADNREDLGRVPVPTLILQSAEDVIAPTDVGAYVHSRIPGSRLVQLEATGHCAHMSAPDETAAAIRAFLDALPPAAKAGAGREGRA
jgi:sigma-B regulation protein RsbQ